MTDEEYTFRQDIADKKRASTGAFHRVSGSKSHYCGLPSDRLTPSQVRKLNGPVTSVKMDEPMTFERFDDLPHDLQQEYLDHLGELYPLSYGKLGQMFGMSDNGAKAALRKRDLKISIPPHLGPKAGHQEQLKWDAFCNGVVGGKPAEMVDQSTVRTEEKPETVDQSTVFTEEKAEMVDQSTVRTEEKPEMVDQNTPKLTVSGTLNLNGTVPEISAYLNTMFGDLTCVSVQVSVKQ